MEPKINFFSSLPSQTQCRRALIIKMKMNGNVVSITTNSFVDTMWAGIIVALDKLFSMVEKNSSAN